MPSPPDDPPPPTVAHEAQALLQKCSVGVLSTHCASHAGYPFGSVVPFALQPDGSPFILVSALAVHTHNLRAQPRCSLLCLEPSALGEDPLPSSRLTLLCDALEAPVQQVPALISVYLARHPAAQQYAHMKDFTPWLLEPVHARMVVGFGRMGWLSWSELRSG